MKRLLAAVVICVMLFYQPTKAQDEYKTGPIDSLKYNDMLLLFSEGFCLTPTYSGLDIISGKDTLVHLAECAIYIYDFCKDSLAIDTDCVLRDINGDGIPEIFTDEYWGGNQCCSEFRIYSLQKPAKILANIIPSIYRLYMDDLDGDSVAEVTHFDAHWVGWKTEDKFEFPYPKIIWKWDGDSMRVANYKFADSILVDTLSDGSKKYLRTEMAVSGLRYTREDKVPSYPPSSFWGMLVNFAYGGRSDKISPLFEEFWPDYNPGREEFYIDFMKRLESDPLWRKIASSDW